MAGLGDRSRIGWPQGPREWLLLWVIVAEAVFWLAVLRFRTSVPLPIFIALVTSVTVMLAPFSAAPRVHIIAPATVLTGTFISLAVHFARAAFRERFVPPRDLAATGIAEMMAWTCGALALLGVVSLGIAGIRAWLDRRRS